MATLRTDSGRHRWGNESPVLASHCHNSPTNLHVARYQASTNCQDPKSLFLGWPGDIMDWGTSLSQCIPRPLSRIANVPQAGLGGPWPQSWPALRESRSFRCPVVTPGALPFGVLNSETHSAINI